MQYTEFERRKYPRFNAEIPVDIGLIDLKSGKRAQAQFKGITKDISMEGMGVELDYPASDILSFAPKLIGANKEFDLDLNKLWKEVCKGGRRGQVGPDSSPLGLNNGPLPKTNQGP